MKYSEAVAYLDSFVNYEKKAFSYSTDLKLNRTYRLLEELGNPQHKFRAVHVAGTKGKGSVCAMVFSILREAGKRCGLYTSPHLVDFRERIRLIDREGSKDRLISEDEICELIETKIKPVVENVKQEEGMDGITFFEVYTAMAFEFFAESGVDIGVIEVGMGGRLDATNAVQPIACGITPISYDHTDKLGSTLTLIAKEKSGIIKEGSLVVSAPQEEEAARVIREVSESMNARLYELGKDITYRVINSSIEGSTFNITGILGEYPVLSIPLIGRHQIVNGATAVGLVELLWFNGISIAQEAIKSGLEKVEWHGRFQILSREPLIIVDGAQNRASAKVLKSTVNDLFKGRRVMLILGISSDKDIEGIGNELCPMADKVIFTKANSPRAEEPAGLNARLSRFCKESIMRDNVREAIREATNNYSNDSLILITGSLYLVGEAIEHIDENAHR